MADRTELTKTFIALSGDRKFDEAVAMLADDVTSTNPMTGTVTGKAAVEAGMRGRTGGLHDRVGRTAGRRRHSLLCGYGSSFRTHQDGLDLQR